MFKVILLFFLFINTLFALEITEDKVFDNILLNSQIYIDKNNSLTIKEIQKKHFTKNTQKSLGFGYSPDFTVWIKFTLENNSDKKINKIIEYANPLTTDITFFDPKFNRSIKDGLIYIKQDRDSLNPIFTITLQPHSSRIFYIKASSYITTLILKIHLWNKNIFYKNEIKHQFILAMFFGAMSVIILYNLLIYLGTREVSYLYYVLFFIGITIHHVIYKGVASLYIFSPDLMVRTVELSSFIVAIPTFFLAFFVKSILELNKYPKLNQALTHYLTIFPIFIILLDWLELYSYRNLFSVFLLILLFFIIIYTFLKKDRSAYFLLLGWILFITSGTFMYLSSLGVFNIFSYIPYYTEFSLIGESLLFSISLADKIKQLHKEKIILQDSLISHQKKEKRKLSNMVELKTKELNESLIEKEILLKELNHRVKNNIQTIVSFLRLQIDDIDDKKTQKILTNLENRIMSISHLYNMLYTKNNISFVNTYEYFSLLIEDIEISYEMPYINIKIQTNINITSQYALYCGFIINEAITNSLQHAFINKKDGNIFINLKKDKNIYKLSISDDGSGYKEDFNRDSLGLVIIETLVVTQLQGELKVNSKKGVNMQIEWIDNE